VRPMYCNFNFWHNFLGCGCLRFQRWFNGTSLSNKIYREMLFVTRRERMAYITMDGLDHVQVSAFSWTPQYRIVLSWDLLGWISVEDRILCSFTNFITTPELSGPLYISPDIYHTQITEYSLETIFLCNYSQWALFSLCIEHLPSHCYFVRHSPFSHYHCFHNPDWSFREHLSRALPTEMIFYLLGSIHSECLIGDYSTGSMLDMLEIIVTWLEVSVSECNRRQTPHWQTKNSICV
jgi:hypothetical protein